MATSIKAIIAGGTHYVYHAYGAGDHQILLSVSGKVGQVVIDLADLSISETPVWACYEITEEKLRGELGKDFARICAKF